MSRFTEFFFFILFFASVTLAHSTEGEKEVSTIVARVNGTTFSASQLQQAVAAHQKKLKKFGKKSDYQPIALRTQRTILDKMINQMLLVQASQSISSPDIEKQVAAALAAKEAQSAMQFARYLEAKKLTRQTYATQLTNKIKMSEYLKEQGIAEAEIPENEIREFYDRGNGMQQEEAVKVRHILLKVDTDAGPDTKKAIKRQIISLRNRITAGEDFAAIARQYSQCKRSSDKGGDLGYVKRHFMPEAFDKEAFSLAKGSVSGPIETEFGMHILQVMDKKEAGAIPYEQARAFLKKYLQEKKMPQLLAEHIEKLREKADIEIFLTEEHAS